MQVEMYIGMSSGRWIMYEVTLPDGTPEEDIERLAKDATEKEMETGGDLASYDIAFHGVYAYGPDEEDEDEETEE